MNIDVNFGGEQVTISIPENSLIDIIDIPYATPMDDPEAAIAHSLQHPTGTPPLQDIAVERKNAVIIVPDRTRPAPIRMVLRHVLQDLEKGGIGKGAIKIIIGIGTHRPMSEDELKQHLGEDTVRHIAVINHKWWDPVELVELGVTKNGTPIQVNKHVYQADLKIALGGVKPHGVVGWSGGAKMIQPAVSGLEATGATHWLSARLQCTGEKIIGTVDNLIRQEMEESAAIVGLDFIVNYVLNKRYQLVGMHSGHYTQAHRKCVELARPLYTFPRKITEFADIVIIGTSKAASNMWANGTGPGWIETVIKRGGTIVLMAPCPDGVADEHPDVLKYGYKTSFSQVRQFVEAGIIQDKAAADHIARCGAQLQNKNLRCILVSKGVSALETVKLGMEYASTPQEAVDAAFQKHGSQARVYLHPGSAFAGLIVE